MTLEKLKEELDKRNIPYEEEKTKKEYNEKINIGELGDMVVFNLAEELEKERKKNKELEIELKEANESITWWQNRFNALQNIDDMTVYLKGLEDGKEKMKECFDNIYKTRIDSAINYLEEQKNTNQTIVDKTGWYIRDKVYNILKGDNK